MRPVPVNPHHVKKSKELDDNNPTKNDRKDPKDIAGLINDAEDLGSRSRLAQSRIPPRTRGERPDPAGGGAEKGGSRVSFRRPEVLCARRMASYRHCVFADRGSERLKVRGSHLFQPVAAPHRPSSPAKSPSSRRFLTVMR